MNKNLIKLLSIIIIFLFLISFFFIQLFNNFRLKNNIADVEQKVESIKTKIAKEQKNMKNISEADKDFLKNAYFDKDNDIFENYIRDIFKKYNVNFKIYQSKLDEKNYSELNITFKVNSFNFFKIVNELEKGKKLTIIEDINILKKEVPYFEVRMTLGAYYR